MPAETMHIVPLLSDLLEGGPEVAVAGIATDSRAVRKGDVFLAFKGISHHGLEFADAAIDAGCVAIAYDPEAAPEIGEVRVPYFEIPELREQLGSLVDKFFHSPSGDVDVFGVTGTNGKTTVAWLLAASLQLLDRCCAYSGTLGYGLDDVRDSGGMTSPDVVEQHRRLAELRDAGARAAAIEVSSHALDQGRVDGVRFKAALFTNLSRDHLDYHGDMASYEAAKAKLFNDFDAELKVINIDTEAGARIAAGIDGPVVTVSMIPDVAASFTVRGVEAGYNGYSIVFDSAWGAGEVQVPLIGAFNVENVALVMATLLALEVPVADVVRAITSVNAPPGRLEAVAISDRQPQVLVDYAHTPDALASVLQAVRPHCRGNLWVVFGCGGDRDQGKRPLMAKAAEQYADRLVITNDNPRGEQPEHIFAQMIDGLSAPDVAEVIEDRAAAIAWAISKAAEEDLVLIAGKGHESEILLGSKRIALQDSAVAAEVLRRMNPEAAE